MENQKIEKEVIVEEVVETEGKTKWYKSGWFKGTLLAVGGIVVGAVATTLLGGDSEDRDDELYLESSEDEGQRLLAESNDDFSVKYEDKE